MSNDQNKNMPEELRERLKREAPAERDELERIWGLLGEHPPQQVPAPDADETWIQLQKELWGVTRNGISAKDREPVRRIRRHQRQSSQTIPTLLAAAVVLAVIGGSLLFWWYQPVIVTSAPGEQVAVALPDGSSVELGGGSSLSYARDFSPLPLLPNDRREVRVDGDAFFDVAEDNRPFVVETFNAQIDVLGTTFNVQTWSDGSDVETEVTLISGQLRIASKTFNEEVVMLRESGHTSRVVGTENAPTSPRPVDIGQVTVWRQQGFHATNQSLSAIFARLERRFDVDIALHVESAAVEPMTLFYSEQVQLETILHDICVAKGLKYRRTSRGYEIVPDANVTKQ